MSIVRKEQRDLSRRVYKGGREIGRWFRGEQVRELAAVEPGDVLYMVSHQFKADNLIRVTGRSLMGGIYWVYVIGDDLVTGEGPHHLWPFDLARTDLYKVVGIEASVL